MVFFSLNTRLTVPVPGIERGLLDKLRSQKVPCVMKSPDRFSRSTYGANLSGRGSHTHPSHASSANDNGGNKGLSRFFWVCAGIL